MAKVRGALHPREVSSQHRQGLVNQRMAVAQFISRSSTAFDVHPPDQPGAKKPPTNPKTINPTMTTAAATTVKTRREGVIFSLIEH
jgi:hypothetical protein